MADDGADYEDEFEDDEFETSTPGLLQLVGVSNDEVGASIQNALNSATNEEIEAAAALAGTKGFVEVCKAAVNAAKDKTTVAAAALLASCVHGHVRLLEALVNNSVELGFAPEVLHQVRDSRGGTVLHVAAEKGHANIIMTLLEQKVSTTTTNEAGLTAADIAKQAGHLDICAVLGSSSMPTVSAEPEPAEVPATAAPSPSGDDWLKSSPALPAVAEVPLVEEAAEMPVELPAEVPVELPAEIPEAAPVESPTNMPPSPAKSVKVVEEQPEPAPTTRAPPAPKKPAQPERASSEPPGMMARTAPVDNFRDDSDGLPARSSNPLFGQGVVSGSRSTPFMVSFSQYKTCPKWSFRSRDHLPKRQRKFDAPGPGAYSLTNVDKFKYSGGPGFGFGKGPRFLGDAGYQAQPGPGQYSPNDPNLIAGAKFGFGTSLRSASKSTVHETPPPGTYDVKGGVGSGCGYTQRGKPKPLVEMGMDSPGPGAYNPSMKVFEHGARFSFGNASRDGGGPTGNDLNCPGPGAYQVQKTLGHHAPKFSIVSRPLGWDSAGSSAVRRMPGPGAYNAHITSFGY
jgi:ankyrin repeat protein